MNISSSGSSGASLRIQIKPQMIIAARSIPTLMIQMHTPGPSHIGGEVCNTGVSAVSNMIGITPVDAQK